MYTKEEEIIHFIFIAFQNQKRKKENIDLTFHSVMVGNMLKNMNCDDNIVNTGYLHDVIEDTNYTHEDLEKSFGKELADNVLKLSENQKITNYKERKEEFINRIKTYDTGLIYVELADKLQNLISDYDLFLKQGKSVVTTNNTSFEDTKWFYKTLKSTFNERLKNNSFLERYNCIYELYFEGK